MFCYRVCSRYFSKLVSWLSRCGLFNHWDAERYSPGTWAQTWGGPTHGNCGRGRRGWIGNHRLWWWVHCFVVCTQALTFAWKRCLASLRSSTFWNKEQEIDGHETWLNGVFMVSEYSHTKIWEEEFSHDFLIPNTVLISEFMEMMIG